MRILEYTAQTLIEAVCQVFHTSLVLGLAYLVIMLL